MKQEVTRYLASQLPDEPLSHLERAAVEHVAGMRYEVWDAHIGSERWWVITNPMNYYTQTDLKSQDVALTFHIGLMTRVLSRNTVPVSDEAAAILPSVWRRWEQAVEALTGAEQSEDFQGVGTHLRECLISFAQEIADDNIVPKGTSRPKASDVVTWLTLFARALAPGESSARLRHYLTALVEPTWSHQQTLLHKKSASRLDAEIGVAGVQHLIACFTAATLRVNMTRSRCESCDGYVFGGACPHCGWEDPSYEPPPVQERSEEELERALLEPCIPSSDISTLMTVDDETRREP